MLGEKLRRRARWGGASGPAPESVRRMFLSREMLVEEKKNGLGARKKKLDDAGKKLDKTVEEILR